ncbi:DNA repair protein-like protein Nse1 [Rhexocercosporidium sp. MPI-PUGE-AT-0058]|nr:DNA repair protein-like protein Nse1 [Rhexocercosporidium sp. MPI-PUGE-AT-0058]
MDYADNAGHGYNNGNRAFLQSFMARGTLTLREAKPLLAAIFSLDSDSLVEPDDVTEEDLNSYISAAADAISPFDYEIRTTQHQVTKERIWAFVNSVSDPLTQMATIRTTEETFYIKRFLDAMFVTYNTRRREVMAISSFQALEAKIRKAGRESVGEEGTQSQAPDKGVTHEQAQALLKSLAEEGWIARSMEGYYTLTPRGLMELKSWLVETYNDNALDENDEWQPIKRCEACKEIVTIGQRCTELDCNVRIHDICEASFWASKAGVKDCPKCKTPWDGKHYVGQKAVTTTEEYLKGKRRSGVSRKRAAELEDSEEEDQPEASGAGSRRRRSRREAATPSESDEE